MEKKNKFYYYHWELLSNGFGISSSLHSQFHVTQACSLLLCSCWPISQMAYCTAVSWTSANTLSPYQYKWISRETYLFPMQATTCKLCSEYRWQQPRDIQRKPSIKRGLRMRVRKHKQAKTSPHLLIILLRLLQPHTNDLRQCKGGSVLRQLENYSTHH